MEKKISSDESFLNVLKNDKDDKNVSSADKKRFVYLNGSLDEDKAKDVIEKLLEFQSEDPLDEITMIINSTGGEVYSMFAITDMMDIIHPPIRTICLGTSQSASAFIFLCGTEGRRFMTRHSSLMLHQVSGGGYGTTKDINIRVEHIKYLQGQMTEEISNRSKMDIESVKILIDRDFHIKPDLAIEYGLCDDVIERLS